MIYSDGQWDMNFFEFDEGTLRAWRVVESEGSIHEPPYANSELMDNIMQYTGLKAQNGEIYEGDILKHELWEPTVVIWEHGMFRGQGDDLDVTLSSHQLQRTKIIGNIYEHPELAQNLPVTTLFQLRQPIKRLPPEKLPIRLKKKC